LAEVVQTAIEDNLHQIVLFKEPQIEFNDLPALNENEFQRKSWITFSRSSQ